MQIPIQIAFRGMDPSAAVEEKIRHEADKLEHFSERITGCRVVVEQSHHRHHRGNLFHVSIDVTLPGGELLVNRDPADKHAHEDVYVAVRDSFDAAKRRIADHMQRLRQEVKAHTLP